MVYKKSHIAWNKGITKQNSPSMNNTSLKMMGNKNGTRDDIINSSITKNELLAGVILSDGHVSRMKTDNCNPQFIMSFSPKFLEFGNVVKLELEKYNIKSTMKLYTRKTGISSYNLTSDCHPNLKLLRNYWYPYGVKIIPKDIIITPKMLAYIFMCDGTSRYTYKDLIVDSIICTDNFTFVENLMLADRISDLGVYFRVLNHRKSYRLHCKTKEDNEKFMKMIEPFMLDCFRYKLKFPRIIIPITVK